MAFLTSYRAEKVYFEKLRSNIDIAKSYIQRGATDEVMALLQNAVDADGAIMLCYRNLGEVWADLAAQLEKTQKALEDLKTALEEYHDDLNKKIDEINNYLIRLINALDDRVTILENESKVKFAYLNHDSVEDVYSIEYNGETADFDTLSAALEYPHLLVLIDNENGNIYYPRSVSDVLIDFHADGVSGTDYVDISVAMSDSDVVTVTEKTVVNYTFGTGFNVSNTNEVTPDLTVLQAKLTAGTGVNIAPDTNEISADFTEVQSKLSAGFGIEIDSSNEISVDTNDVQEKLIAGQNITLTPDSTDPTKTVIDAAGGGASYSAGNGIDIDANNIISIKGVYPNSDSMDYLNIPSTQQAVEFENSALIQVSKIKTIGDLQDYPYFIEYFTSKIMGTDMFSVNTSLEYALNNWANKMDFILFMNTGIVSDVNNITGYIMGKTFKKEYVFENGNIKAIDAVYSASPQLADSDTNVIPMRFTGNVSDNRYLIIRVQLIPIVANAGDGVKLRDFYNSLSASQKSSLIAPYLYLRK